MEPLNSLPGWVISIAGTVIILLLGIVGYFFKRTLDSMDSLSGSVDKLSKTTISLRATMEAQDENIDTMRIDNKEQHMTISQRLDEHGKKIQLNTIDIELLKQKNKQ